MAKGKNKRLPRKGKGRKNERHAFSRKLWFTLISPKALKKQIPVGWSPVKRATGTEVQSDFLKGRVAEICYADITGNIKDVPKKVKMVVDEVHGTILATSFYSFQLSRDSIYERLKKRQSLIDVFTDVKSQDGFVYRLFVMVVTNRRQNQKKLNSYAKASKIRVLRKKLISELVSFAATVSGNNLAFEVITNVIDTKLEKLAQTVLPGCRLQVYKMKTVKRGNVDLKALVKDATDAQKQVETLKSENPEAQNKLTAEQEKVEPESS